jgi:tape measure domain-containing protein
MAESYSVEAILSARDAGFTAGMKAARKSTESLGSVLKKGLGFGAFAAIGSKVTAVVGNSISDLIGGMNEASATWKTFSGNMTISGKTTKQTTKVRKDLQKFAEQTIYSSSDMASTYAQLAAVGTKNTTKLVKGFGGLASAAEDPKQAMKTLSQQATQMAAKPKVQWEDFKLMVEQTPAGVAAVAKTMGKSTQQMIKDVQDGKISTEEFFDAVAKTGTNKQFTKMATEYKTVGQAMDGLAETVSNKLQPAFDSVSSVGIKAVSAITDSLDKINGKAIAKKIEPFTKSINSVATAFSKNGINGAISEITNQISKSNGAVKQFGAAVSAAFVVTHLNDFLNTFKSVTEGMGKVKFPDFSKKMDFSNFSKNALKKTRGIKKSFASLGTGIDEYGSKIAMSMEAISPKLSDTGIKIWEVFSKTGEKASAFGKTLSKGLTSKLKGIFKIFSTLGSKVSTILASFQQIFAGVLGIGGKMVNGLTSMMGLALKALMPAALVAAVLAGFGLLYQQFGTQIDQMLALAQTKGPQVISNLANGISSALPGLIVSGAQLVTGLMDTITANLPAIISGGTQIISNLVSGLSSAAPSLIAHAAMMIGQFVISIGSALPQLITTGMQLIASLAQGLASSLPTLISSATQAVTAFIGGIGQNLPQILATAVQIIVALAQGLITGIPQIIAAVPQIASALVGAIMSTDWLQVGKNVVSAIGQGLTNVKNWFTGGKKGGQETSSGVASGISSGSGQVTSAAETVTNNVTNKLKSGSGAAKSAGNTVINGYSSAITNGAGKVTAAVSNSTAKITGSMKKSGNAAKSAGKQTGNGYTTALRSGLNKAPNVASSAVSKVNAKLRSGRSGAHAAGAYISQGFAQGMSSCLGQIEAAASRMVAAADKAIRAKAKIHSPSKMTEKDGKFMGSGFAKGIKKSTGKVKKVSEKLTKAALQKKKTNVYAKAIKSKVSHGIKAGLKSVKKKTKNLLGSSKTTLLKANQNRQYEDMASKAIDKYKTTINKKVSSTTKSLKKKVDAVTKSYQKKYKKNAKLKKAYTNAGKGLKEKITKKIKTQGNAAIKAVDATLTALGKKYQTKYDAIASDRSNFISKMSDYGDLFKSDDYGFISLVDFKSQTNQINALAKNMEHLKKVLPYNMMKDIQALDTAQGLKYTNELLKKGDTWLKQYGKDYTNFITTAKKNANAYYQPYVTKLDTEYVNAVTKAIKDLQKKMNVIGTQASKGLVKGVSNKKNTKKVKKASNKLASTVPKTAKKKLKVHSPSRVMDKIAYYTGIGFVNRLEAMRKNVQSAMQGIVDVPAQMAPSFAGNFNGELSSDYEYYTKAEYTVNVPLEINGKEFARATAQDTMVEQNRLQRRNNRKNGKV